jgi:NAD(P)-dependent dehydrogenase (short-subunit alcohol dehydrogenase family)
MRVILLRLSPARSNAGVQASRRASPADMQRLFETARAKYDRIDVVVSCGGIMPLAPICGD